MIETAAALPAHSPAATHARITWRLMPLLLVCYLFAHLDRINIGFAKMQMSADLGFSDTVYGLGAGLFFVAYALFGVPSNLALDRVGPRRWIATLMVVWGLLSTGMLWVQDAPASTPCAFCSASPKPASSPASWWYSTAGTRPGAGPR
jgi:sugar phosphate permease